MFCAAGMHSISNGNVFQLSSSHRVKESNSRFDAVSEDSSPVQLNI